MSHNVAPPAHAAHFSDREQRIVADHLGMWTFLCTEILFFGGFFAAYSIYRWTYPKAFIEGSQHLDFWIGTINTAVLLTSSAFIALGDHAIKAGQVRTLRRCLVGAWLLGAVFLTLKGIEYHHKWVEQMVPGAAFHADNPQLEIFMFIYFGVTGLHAVHMIVGLIVLAWLWWSVQRGLVTPEEPTRVEIFGLYWHFVDVVWVFLYPLLYLIR